MWSVDVHVGAFHGEGGAFITCRAVCAPRGSRHHSAQLPAWLFLVHFCLLSMDS